MFEGFSQPNLTSQDFMMSQLQSDQVPSSIGSIPTIVKLDHLVIKNFKSFKQQTYTGPFLSFTSIIGPNGSGKSNILDALMFCLCGQNLKQNFYDLRQYINRQKTQSYKQMSKKQKVCSVTANFILSDRGTLSLRRQLNAQGQQTFSINTQVVSKKLYQNFLHKQGINPHLPNYAITQGQIDKLLLREPIQLSKYIQNLSGSYLYKKQYDALHEQKQKIRDQIIHSTQILQKLRQDKKNVRNLNAASKQCQQLEKQYDLLITRLFLAKVWMKQQDLIEFENLINKKKQEENKRIQEINRKKLKIQEQIKQKQQLNKQINHLNRKITQLQGQMKTLNRPDIIIKTNQIQNLSGQIKFLQQEKDLVQKRREVLINNIKSKGEEVHNQKVVEQYLALFTQYQRKNRQVSIQLSNKKTLFYNLQSQRQFQKSLLEDEKEKHKQTQLLNQKRLKDLELTNKEINDINQLVKKLKKESKDFQQINKRYLLLKKQKYQNYQKLSNQIQSLEDILTQGIQSEKDKEIVKKLSLVNGFRGIIQQKIKPTAQKYLVAFSVLTNSINKYLLCIDEPSSSQISDKLKNMNVIKNLIILGNIKKLSGNASSQYNKQVIGKSGVNAMEIVDFQKNIQGLDALLQDFCRGKIICDDLKTAFELRNKKISGVRQIITLNGQVIRTDGIISANGNIENIKRIHKLNTNKKSIQAQLQKLIKSRDQLRVQIDKLQKQFQQKNLQKLNEQIYKLQKKRQDLQQKAKFLSTKRQSASSLSMGTYKQIQKDIQMIGERQSKIQKQIQTIQKSISKDSIMSQFMKKHKITNLETFRSVSNIQKLQRQRKQRMKLDSEIQQFNDKIKQIDNKIKNKSLRVRALREDLNKKIVEEDKNKNKSKKDNKMQSQQIIVLRTKPQVEKQIQQCFSKIKQVRKKISSLAVWTESDLRPSSQIVQMETKYKLLHQKFKQAADLLKNQLGVKIPAPRTTQDYKLLQQYLQVPSIKQLSYKRLQKCVKDLQSQRKISSQRLQTYNSVKITQRDHQKEQADINNEIKQLMVDTTNYQKNKEEIQQKLLRVREERKKIFLEFFDKVKVNVKECYKVLTEMGTGAYGRADLYLENSDLPFDNGVYYTPTPPNKRYVYDLEQLSGGQKSIASLALQYALAISSNSPFLVLDESDSYLDSNNSSKLLKLLNQSTHSKDNKLQIILVTHKLNIFGQCESIVGVTRPPQQFSKVYSLRLKSSQGQYYHV